MSGLLVYALPGALRTAERLLPGKTLENEVERAILANRKRPFLPRGLGSLGRDQRSVFLDGGVIAVIAKGRPRLRDDDPRRVWVVQRLIPGRERRSAANPDTLDTTEGVAA